MKVDLQYGTEGLSVDLPSRNVTMISPKYLAGLPDEAAAFRQAVEKPIDSPPLRELISANDRLAVVIPDITRPLPSDRLLPWLFEHLDHVPVQNITIVNGTGSHRSNTPEELKRMVGADVMRRYNVVNHNAHDASTLVLAGLDARGHEVYFNRQYAEADKRIVLGFIEPHLMAGFSGGFKGVFPAVADIHSIMRYHDAAMIGHPRSTWGLLEGNPTQATVRHNGALLPLDFCINVTLNSDRQITRYFCGDVRAAHEAGCAFAKQQAMAACPHEYKLVLTTNSGYPLDQSLYQTVKGMSAASMVVSEGGYILTAARCNDGFPEHGNFRKLLLKYDSPRAMLEAIHGPGFSIFDQWQVQILAQIQLKARIGIYSELSAEDVRDAHLEPVDDIATRVAEELESIGRDAPIAVLPEGPQTIPYVAA